MMQFLDLLVDIPEFGLSNWPNQLVGKGGSRATGGGNPLGDINKKICRLPCIHCNPSIVVCFSF